MYQFKEFCALIFNGVTLYNGLKSDNGALAVYGEGDFVYSLQKYGTIDIEKDMEAMLAGDSSIQLQKIQYSKHPRYITVCVSKNDGNNGLKKYLNSRGFRLNNRKDEKAASQKFNKPKIPPSRIYPLGQYAIGSKSIRGREIAAAVTMGYVHLSGKYGCISVKDSKNPLEIQLRSPLDIGFLNLIQTVELTAKKDVKSIDKALVYINGNLRLLISHRKIEKPSDNLIWEIYPKLDATENRGLMSKNMLENFLDEAHDLNNYLEENVTEKVLLGCYREP